MISGAVKLRFVVIPAAGWLMLNGRFAFPSALMLCNRGSLFRISSCWPTMIPKTRGWYMHPFWSITTAVAGTGYWMPGGSPAFTYTNTSASAPLGFTTTICSRGGVV